ncbi:MAG: type II toxin-antitoxin system HicB family antitoxin [Verrucomicrobiota bacterium]
MNDLRYCQLALKLDRVVKLDGDEGYLAKIPGFRGLLATGENKREVLKELSGALEAWVLLALRRGMSLPKLKLPEEVTA